MPKNNTTKLIRKIWRSSCMSIVRNAYFCRTCVKYLQLISLLLLTVFVTYWYYGYDVYRERQNFDKMVKFYKNQSRKRWDFLHQVQMISNDDLNKKYGMLYDGLVPEAQCTMMLYVGTIGKDGRWICRPESLPNGCSIYSFGIANGSDFEFALQKLTQFRCKLYIYEARKIPIDYYMNIEEMNGLFEPTMLSNINNPSNKEKTIHTILSERGDTNYVELIKTDLREYEFQLLPILLFNVKACQLILDLHDRPDRIWRLLKFIGRRGYYLLYYSIERMNIGVASYTFLHMDCLEKYDAKLIAMYLGRAEKRPDGADPEDDEEE